MLHQLLMAKFVYIYDSYMKLLNSYWFFILNAHKNSKACEMSSKTSHGYSVRVDLIYSQSFHRPATNLITVQHKLNRPYK